MCWCGSYVYTILQAEVWCRLFLQAKGALAPTRTPAPMCTHCTLAPTRTRAPTAHVHPLARLHSLHTFICFTPALASHLHFLHTCTCFTPTLASHLHLLHIFTCFTPHHSALFTPPPTSYFLLHALTGCRSKTRRRREKRHRRGDGRGRVGVVMSC